MQSTLIVGIIKSESKRWDSPKGAERMIIMTKTFYSVNYSTWGSSSTSTKWFDSLDAAKAFATEDYTDEPVAHRCSKPETIKRYEALVASSAKSDADCF